MQAAQTSISSYSNLSSETAVDFELTAAAGLHLDLSIDDVILPKMLSAQNEVQFIQEYFIFHMKQHIFEGKTRLLLEVGCLSAAQWHLLFQMRIQTAKRDAELKVVDMEVVEFCPEFPSLQVDVTSPEVATVRFELRTINKQYSPLPQFNIGDISILFEDGSSIKTYKALLAMASTHIANLLSADPSTECISVGSFPQNDLLELLYQFYPINRPLSADFRGIANASNAFKVDAITYKMSRQLVEGNGAPLTIQEKLQTAIGLELDMAVQEIVFRAVQDGSWEEMLHSGFNPVKFFNETIYRILVCPAIIKARQAPFGGSMLKNPFKQPLYTSDLSVRDASNVCLLFCETPLYVNRGILQVNGMDALMSNEKGQLMAKYSREMQMECAQLGLTPGQVLISLLDFLHPGGPAPSSEMLRPSIVFCFDHKWNSAKDELEQLLLLEPATNPQQYLSQIVFAERFQLENMIRNCVFRAENSCFHFAVELHKFPEFLLISAEVRDRMVHRMCSGWSLQPQFINRLGMRSNTRPFGVFGNLLQPNVVRKATSHRERDVDLNRGGAVGYNAAGLDDTLCELQSDNYFGSANELVIV